MIGTDENDDLRAFVAGNPGQGSFEEYRCLRDAIRRRRPSNLLVFGLGKDTKLWIEANEGGRTVFVEHEAEWIELARRASPGIVVHQVKYETLRKEWKKLLKRQDLLFMEDLPNEVIAANWDIIFVDSPQGGHDRRPGRSKSIYTASILARRSTDVDIFVHDCDRELERVYADTFLGANHLVEEIRTLRHYHLR